MKQETYEKAKMLEQRILHIIQIRNTLNEHIYSDPPIRDSGFELWRRSATQHCFNNGEMEVIKKAFEEEHTRLLREFAEL